MIINNKIISLKDALTIVEDAPEIEYVFWGIPNLPSVTLIAARAKAGKSIFMENFALALANSEVKDFLGMAILTFDKIAVLSFEEILKPRTLRQKKQIEGLDSESKKDITEKIYVFNEDGDQFISSKEEQQDFIKTLLELNPEIVFIDSLGRLGMGQIEDSSFARMLMLFVRECAFIVNCPFIVLHHTVKTKKSDLVELSSMAGSRVVAQEADAVLTILDGQDGIKILKPLAWRYYGDNDTEIHFKINDYCLLEHISTNTGGRIHTKPSETKSIEKIFKYISEVGRATSQDLEEVFVRSKIMSRSTLFESLGKLNLGRPEKGVYTYLEQKVVSGTLDENVDNE